MFIKQFLDLLVVRSSSMPRIRNSKALSHFLLPTHILWKHLQYCYYINGRHCFPLDCGLIFCHFVPLWNKVLGSLVDKHPIPAKDQENWARIELLLS